MCDDATFPVEDEAVAALPEPNRIDGVLREVIPTGAHGHGAEELTILVVNGLCYHINQHIPGGRLHDALTEGEILSAEYGLAVIAVQAIAAG